MTLPLFHPRIVLPALLPPETHIPTSLLPPMSPIKIIASSILKKLFHSRVGLRIHHHRHHHHPTLMNQILCNTIATYFLFRFFFLHLLHVIGLLNHHRKEVFPIVPLFFSFFHALKN